MAIFISCLIVFYIIWSGAIKPAKDGIQNRAENKKKFANFIEAMERKKDTSRSHLTDERCTYEKPLKKIFANGMRNSEVVVGKINFTLCIVNEDINGQFDYNGRFQQKRRPIGYKLENTKNANIDGVSYEFIVSIEIKKVHDKGFYFMENREYLYTTNTRLPEYTENTSASKKPYFSSESHQFHFFEIKHKPYSFSVSDCLTITDYLLKKITESNEYYLAIEKSNPFKI